MYIASTSYVNVLHEDEEIKITCSVFLKVLSTNKTEVMIIETNQWHFHSFC